MSNPFHLSRVGNPLFEAITVAELKKHMRVFNSQDDTYIGDLALAARMQVEKDFNLALVGQEYNLNLENGFYYFYHYWELPYSPEFFRTFNWVYHYPKIPIPIQPISKDYEITITYTDPNGDPQTLDASNYVPKLYKDPPEIMLKNTPLPSIQPGSDIVVNFTAGFVATNAVSTIPQIFKQAIQLLVGAWYENREGVSDALIRPVPLGYEWIKQLYEVKRFY